MIEKTVLDWLNTNLDVTAYMEVPKDAPEKYVLIEKTGSGMSDRILFATFALQSIAQSMYEAAQLNDSVKIAMNDLIELDEVSRSALNSDYNFTDTQKKEYRYQAVYDLVYYED